MAKRESLKKLTAEIGERKAAVWPKDRIDRLADEMLAWWLADDTRITWAAFWAERDDLTWYRELPVYLGNRSERFAHVHARCQLIQESRLVQRGMLPKVNPTFLMFLLVNVGGYVPMNSVNVKNTTNKIELPAVNLQVGQPHPTIELKDVPLITPPVPLKSGDLGPNSAHPDSETV